MMRFPATPRLILALACCLAASGAGAAVEGDCSGAASSLPARASSADGGREFARRMQALSGPARDLAVEAEVRAGNIPEHLRHARALTLAPSLPGMPRVTLCVLPDYLAVGSDEDFVLVPLGLRAALSLAVEFGFELPTRRIVDAIHRQAVLRLDPRPLPPGDEMRSTAYITRHNAIVQAQRAQSPTALDALTAGHKKDLVLTPRLWSMPGRVAIYGWHQADGRAIQPLSLVHGARYADYSHGVRLVSDTAWLDGQPRPLYELLGDPASVAAVSDEGPIAVRGRIGALLGDAP